jgi:hypothetical protein
LAPYKVGQVKWATRPRLRVKRVHSGRANSERVLEKTPGTLFRNGILHPSPCTSPHVWRTYKNRFGIFKYFFWIFLISAIQNLLGTPPRPRLPPSRTPLPVGLVKVQEGN